MSEARCWRKNDGTLVLEWPEDKRTLPITRELMVQLVDELNERVTLRAALDEFLLFDSMTFESREDLAAAWESACRRARGLMGMVAS